eukprot:877538-Rhodomonas_salina.1
MVGSSVNGHPATHGHGTAASTDASRGPDPHAGTGGGFLAPVSGAGLGPDSTSGLGSYAAIHAGSSHGSAAEGFAPGAAFVGANEGDRGRGAGCGA